MLNCFAIPANDSREGWGDVLRNVTIISGTGGGCGICFSKIRPRGTKIRGMGGEATGSVSLMIAVNAICNELREGGGRRCLPEHFVQVMSGDFKQVIAKECTGQKQLVEINTQMGVFHSTKEHRFAVLDNLDGDIRWVTAENLRPGDRLIFIDHGICGQATELPTYNHKKPKMATTTKDIKIPNLDTEIAWFFGQLHGDGYVSLGSKNVRASVSMGCSNDLPEQHKRIVGCFEKFGCAIDEDHKPKISHRYGRKEKCSKPRVVSIQLAQYLSQFKLPSVSINIPDFILRGTEKIRGAYIAGLLDAD